MVSVRAVGGAVTASGVFSASTSRVSACGSVCSDFSASAPSAEAVGCSALSVAVSSSCPWGGRGSWGCFRGCCVPCVSGGSRLRRGGFLCRGRGACLGHWGCRGHRGLVGIGGHAQRCGMAPARSRARMGCPMDLFVLFLRKFIIPPF